MAYSSLFIAILAPLLVNADVRIDSDRKAFPFRVPDTFCYAALAAQQENANDNFIRSNIDNQQNQRNVANEPPVDMLPCRSDTRSELLRVQKGVTVEVPIRWNNPHDASCEFNIWIKNQTEVVNIKKPFPCGGGYANQTFTFTIPEDFSGCTDPGDGCFIQMYGHSVEPRSYAICTDFVIASGNSSTSSNSTIVGRNSIYDVNTTIPKPAIHYSDAYHFTHVDSNYSPYQGQNWDDIRDEVKAAITIKSFIVNGGLVGKTVPDLGKAEALAELANTINSLVGQAEQAAIQKNQAAQKALDAKNGLGANRVCFEGDIYNIVKDAQCTRQYTNTYVTNVGYAKVAQEISQLASALGVKGWEATIKNNTYSFSTPVDPIGSFVVNGAPSKSPIPGTPTVSGTPCLAKLQNKIAEFPPAGPAPPVPSARSTKKKSAPIRRKFLG